MKNFDKKAVRSVITTIRKEIADTKDSIRSCAMCERDTMKQIKELKAEITDVGTDVIIFQDKAGKQSGVLQTLRERLEKRLEEERKEMNNIAKEAKGYKETLKVLDHVITVLIEEFTEGGKVSRMAREFNENQEKGN